MSGAAGTYRPSAQLEVVRLVDDCVACHIAQCLVLSVVERLSRAGDLPCSSSCVALCLCKAPLCQR